MSELQTTTARWTVLVVDDTPQNIDVLRGILKHQYDVKAAIDGKTALKVAEKVQPDLILLDIMMPGMTGLEVCERLKANPETAHIPVIFVTALSEIEDEQRGFDAGAVDYITKPVQPPVVMARVRTHLALAHQQRSCQQVVTQRTRELQDSQRSAIYMLGEAGHYNDTDTGQHIWRMAAYAAALARAINWPVPDAELLELAAPMHDTGKIGVPDSVLKAPRKLEPDEWEIMKTHTTVGHRILSKSDTPLFRLAAEIALSHHEKWDGSGYPDGLAEEDIPEAARIVAIADVFDALTMQRPYKAAWSVEEALQEIREGTGSSFEPRLVDAFLGITDEILAIKARYDNHAGGTGSEPADD